MPNACRVCPQCMGHLFLNSPGNAGEASLDASSLLARMATLSACNS